MSRSRMNCVLSILAALALAMPLAARSGAGKTSKSTARASMDLSKDASFGGKQLKAGTYDVKASESTLTLMQNGKVVAEAPIAWKDEESKSPYSAIVTESGAVTEVHFNGKKSYAHLSSGSMSSAGQE
jgi:hypothetical protein